MAYFMARLLFYHSPGLRKIQIKSVIKTRPRVELCSFASRIATRLERYRYINLLTLSRIKSTRFYESSYAVM